MTADVRKKVGRALLPVTASPKTRRARVPVLPRSRFSRTLAPLASAAFAASCTSPEQIHRRRDMTADVRKQVGRALLPVMASPKTRRA